MRRNKFRRELKKADEIKANKSSNAIRKHMLIQLQNIPCRIYAVAVKKEHIRSSFLRRDKISYTITFRES